ncbi:MAG: PaaI family thioesterase [Deltaproteobacteria bacterium]|nr:PaaI family thioesterase [Deltaproteobacteria bacterium]MBW2360035.1 PaaI family thioesterase [Deltaproteobacteria bacterium]
MSDVSIPFGITPPDALYELAEAMRGVVEQMVRIDEPHPELARAQEEVEAIAERLDGIARKGVHPRMLPNSEPNALDARPYYPGDATRWHCNPFHPPLELERKGDKMLRGRFRLGLTHEGPPGCAHGGYVAMVFDQVLGHANVLFGIPGLTARLVVRYRRPTPLFEELVLETDAPQVMGARRCVVKGRILHDGLVTASGECLFSRPDVEFTDLALLGSQR